jgi:hypothetical protein
VPKKPRICPYCKKELEERKIVITYPNGDVKTDTVYVCLKGSCGGVFVPQSIFGVHP